MKALNGPSTTRTWSPTRNDTVGVGLLLVASIWPRMRRTSLSLSDTAFWPEPMKRVTPGTFCTRWRVSLFSSISIIT